MYHKSFAHRLFHEVKEYLGELYFSVHKSDHLKKIQLLKYSGFKTLNSTKDGYIIESLKNTRYNRISFCHANFQIACYIHLSLAVL